LLVGRPVSEIVVITIVLTVAIACAEEAHFNLSPNLGDKDAFHMPNSNLKSRRLMAYSGM